MQHDSGAFNEEPTSRAPAETLKSRRPTDLLQPKPAFSLNTTIVAKIAADGTKDAQSKSRMPRGVRCFLVGGFNPFEKY